MLVCLPLAAPIGLSPLHITTKDGGGGGGSTCFDSENQFETGLRSSPDGKSGGKTVCHMTDTPK